MPSVAICDMSNSSTATPAPSSCIDMCDSRETIRRLLNAGSVWWHNPSVRHQAVTAQDYQIATP